MSRTRSGRTVALVSVGAAAALVASGFALVTGGAPAQAAPALTPYEGCDALLAYQRAELRATASAYGIGSGSPIVDVAGGPTAALAGAARAGAGGASAGLEKGSADSAVGPGATGTNVQERGVDEPDFAKLADGRLLVVRGGTLRVLSADDQPRLLGTVRIGAIGTEREGLRSDDVFGGGFSDSELLVVGDRIVVVSTGLTAFAGPAGSAAFAGSTGRDLDVWRPITRLTLVELTAGTPRLVERADYDGTYVSARLTGSTVRLVTDSTPRVQATFPRKGGRSATKAALAENRRRAATATLGDVLPYVTRTDAAGRVIEHGPALDCTRVSHPVKPRGSALLAVTTLHPAAGLAAVDSVGVVADGDVVYAAQDRLFVATSTWGTVGPVAIGPMAMDGAAGAAAEQGLARPVPDEVTTQIHAFDTTSADGTRYVGSGSVAGYLLNRWAMSWHEGALRVATTREPAWGTVGWGTPSGPAAASSSSIVKLAESDGRLVETGRIDGLGRTERIKAVRFLGDLAALVTFRETDPLYLVDLSGGPRVLGELKVPGFSTYLHPIGDGRLLAIGFAGDTEVFAGDGRPADVGGMRRVQLSVFDVGDLSRPRLVDRFVLGAGYSPALDESRAFTYDPARRTAYLGFTSFPVDGAARWNDAPRSHVVGVAVSTDGDLSLAGRLPISREQAQGRVLLDGDRFYAVSGRGVVAARADSLAESGAVHFDQ